MHLLCSAEMFLEEEGGHLRVPTSPRPSVCTPGPTAARLCPHVTSLHIPQLPSDGPRRSDAFVQMLPQHVDVH